MEERLQKIISASGAASRRAAEELIKNGRVTVNGLVASLGDKADPEHDSIELDGKALPGKADHIYIMLNKPRGYVTTTPDEFGRPTVMELVDAGKRVYPVGRLDMDSEGLLLLTNDGDFHMAVTHPSREKEKTYVVHVSGNVPGALDRLRQPFELDGYITKPAKVELAENRDDVLIISIHEGRKRQIRRICAICGLEVKKLCRVSIGPVKLGDLQSGHWRYLTNAEINALTADKRG
ncbi:MAG: rRNA pseudouridine synthase [Oscillospiraceae bacterium]|nr:rRNA pseudouridine synthase [Oscillospiraceae bacterium]